MERSPIYYIYKLLKIQPNKQIKIFYKHLIINNTILKISIICNKNKIIISTNVLRVKNNYLKKFVKKVLMAMQISKKNNLLIQKMNS